MTFDYTYLGSLLKGARESVNMKQSEVAELIGCTSANVSSWERGKSKIDIESLISLSKIYQIDFNDLLHNVQNQQISEFASFEKEIIKKYRTLDEYGKEAVDKILDVEYNRCANNETSETNTIELPFSLLKASAGTGEWLDEEQLDKITVTDTPTARKADIVIEVDGDSMITVFNDGDKVLVRLQPAVEIGEIGIFIIDNMGYIKKYANDRLISLNPDYNDIYPNEYTHTKCIGKVIGKI